MSNMVKDKTLQGGYIFQKGTQNADFDFQWSCSFDFSLFFFFAVVYLFVCVFFQLLWHFHSVELSLNIFDVSAKLIVTFFIHTGV